MKADRPDCGVRPVCASDCIFGTKGLLAKELQQISDREQRDNKALRLNRGYYMASRRNEISVEC